MANDRDDEERRQPSAPRADLDPHPGQPATGQQTDYQRHTQRLRLIAVASAVGLTGAACYLFFGSSGQAPSKPLQTAAKSSATFTSIPNTAPGLDATNGPRLDVFPKKTDFGSATVGDGKHIAQVKLTVTAGSYDITSIVIPYAVESGLSLQAGACQSKTLHTGEQCAVQVVFQPTAALTAQNNLAIAGNSFDPISGKSTPFTQYVEIDVSAIAPPAPPAPPPPPPALQTVSASTAPAIDPNLITARVGYLSSRQKPVLAMASSGASGSTGDATDNKPQRPVDLDWKSAGFTPSLSSYPVDLSRILTMDKPIPAVLKVGIDARNASRAIATVERDMYGGDGRIVVLERGSTLIGTVGVVSESSTEKVAISWVRVQRPDGAVFRIEAISGDAIGRSGVLASIDNRWMARFGNAVLATVLESVTVGLANGNQTSTNTGGATINGTTVGGTTATSLDGRALASQTFTSGIAPLLKQYQQERLAIQVIRTVPAGTRITVYPTADLELRPVETAANLPIVRQNRTTAPSTGGGLDFGPSSASGRNPYAVQPNAPPPNPNDGFVAEPVRTPGPTIPVPAPSFNGPDSFGQTGNDANGGPAIEGRPGYQRTGVLPSSATPDRIPSQVPAPRPAWISD
jgi:type IV secretory pathway VirB10-like protein